MVEHVEAHNPLLQRFRSWLGIPERARHPLLWIWPIVVIVVAGLALRLVTNAKELADLISAFAALMWPVAVVTIVGWFRPEIQTVLSRIRKGKFLGQEIELDELQAKTEEAEATEPTVVNISDAGSEAGTPPAQHHWSAPLITLGSQSFLDGLGTPPQSC